MSILREHTVNGLNILHLNGWFMVESEKFPGQWYVVTPGLICGCKSFEHSKMPKSCKHVRAINKFTFRHPEYVITGKEPTEDAERAAFFANMDLD